MRECTFDHLTFLEAFERDLQHVRLSVLIQSSFVSDLGISRLEHRFKDLANRKIPVCMFLQQPHGWTNPAVITTDLQLQTLNAFKQRIEILRSLHVHVNVRQFIHEKVIVLDFGILYDGGMNVMSYNPMRTTERITRREHAYKSLCAIAKHSLDSCIVCTDRPDLDESPAFCIERDSAGVSLAALRTSKGMTQQELATRISMTTRGLGKIENGKSLPKLSTVIEICDTLETTLVAVPKYAVPYVMEIARVLPRQTTSPKLENYFAPPASVPHYVSSSTTPDPETPFRANSNFSNTL